MNYRTLVVALLGLIVLQLGWSVPAGAASTQTKTTKASTAKAPAKKAVKKAVAKKKSAAAAKKVVKKPAAALLEDEPERPLELDARGNPQLRSAAFLVVNQTSGEVILEKRSDSVVPIASITKLMTAMVVLDAGQSLSEELTITAEDIDLLKGTGSRLAVGTRLTREEMLQLALMSSENRAASALGRHYPGGIAAFVEAMNVKARMIGLWDSRFLDSTGLNPGNVSSPRDLVKLVSAASSYPLIREFSTTSERHVQVGSRLHRFGNTNALVRSDDWQIGLSKTGYIREAGRCLVMQAWIHQQPVIIVLMDSEGRYTRTADAQRIRKWFDAAGGRHFAAAAGGAGI